MSVACRPVQSPTSSANGRLPKLISWFHASTPGQIFEALRRWYSPNGGASQAQAAIRAGLGPEGEVVMGARLAPSPASRIRPVLPRRARASRLVRAQVAAEVAVVMNASAHDPRYASRRPAPVARLSVPAPMPVS